MARALEELKEGTHSVTFEGSMGSSHPNRPLESSLGARGGETPPEATVRVAQASWYTMFLSGNYWGRS